MSLSEKPKGFKSGTFHASGVENRHLATGDYEGNLAIWDLEDMRKPIFQVRAHDKIINCVEGYSCIFSPASLQHGTKILHR